MYPINTAKNYSVKIIFKNETRRLQLSESSLNFHVLKKTITDVIPSLRGQDFLIKWLDDEDDLIALSSDIELSEAVRVMENLKSNKLLRFQVLLSDDSTNEQNPTNQQPPQTPKSNVIHRGVTCDDCGISPMVGIRYKCAVRNDFDICEACEAKGNHPYPLVKIVDPTHAPSVLIYAFQDDNLSQRSPHSHPHAHPHMHHHPHKWGGMGRCGPPGAGRRFPPHPWDVRSHHNPPPPPINHQRCPPPGFGPNRRGPPYGCPYFAKRDPAAASEPTSKEEPLPSQEDHNSKTPSNAPSEGVEGEDVNDEPPSNSFFKTVESFARSFGGMESKEGDENQLFIKIADAVLGHPTQEIVHKPALRFVKHVTCPDGTLVPPGVPFCKTWRVRNDGKCAWPHGTVLVHSGGDLLTYEEPLSLDAMPAPGEEIEITINLKAPECTGRFVSYFRMQSPGKDQPQFFGQRLWADVIVSEVEPDWQVVHTATAVQATVVDDAKPLNPVTVEDVEDDGMEPSVDIRRLPEPMPAVPIPSPAPVEKWSEQLEELANMGFFDRAALVPLLELHWTSEQGLQAVLDELLQ